PGAQKVFLFTVAAPTAPGRYDFQWQMAQGSAAFGELGTDVTVDVAVVDPSFPNVQDVWWTNDAGVAVSGNSLTKTADSGWGNAGASSAQTIASGDGYVEFTAGENTKYTLGGLSHG